MFIQREHIIGIQHIVTNRGKIDPLTQIFRTLSTNSDEDIKKAFEKTINEEPSNPTHYHRYANWLQDAGHHEEASLHRGVASAIKSSGLEGKPTLSFDIERPHPFHARNVKRQLFTLARQHYPAELDKSPWMNIGGRWQPDPSHPNKETIRKLHNFSGDLSNRRVLKELTDIHPYLHTIKQEVGSRPPTPAEVSLGAAPYQDHPLYRGRDRTHYGSYAKMYARQGNHTAAHLAHEETAKQMLELADRAKHPTKAAHYRREALANLIASQYHLARSTPQEIDWRPTEMIPEDYYAL